ncbi:ATPase [Aureococcus anophagefferens]|nr:ATPase [Aureococcus anophagefferens]
MSMSGDHCDALANTSLEVLQFGGAVAAACYVRAKLRAPAHPGAYALLTTDDAEVNGAALRDALLTTDDAEAGGATLRAVRAEVGPYWVAELAAGLVAGHKLLSLCAENARAHQRVPHPYPAVGGVASCLAYALVARLFSAVSSSPPGGGKRTRAGERAASAALCAWCGLGVLFEATCPSDRFYVAPHTDAGGRDGEAAVRLVALSVGFARALAGAPAAVELREAPATPEEAASLLSFVTFGYFTPVVDKGAAPKRYQLSGGDVPPVAPDAGAAACLRAFEGAFDEAPASAFWLGPALAPWDFWTAAAFQLGAVCFQFAPSPPSTRCSPSSGAAAPRDGARGDAARMMRGKTVGLKVQAAACAAVFRKALTVDPFGAKFSVGECVNLMATDARTLCRLFTFGHQLWAAPLQTAVAVAGLCFLIGWAALPGVAVVLFSMRCTTELTKRVKRRQRSMEQAWKLFYRAWFKVFRNVGTVVGFAAFATSRAAWYLALDGRAATAGTTEGFTALVLFATLRSGLAIWPQVVQIYVQASVGWERIANFLGRDDLQAGATGKSSLLRALLGELRLSGATAALGGRVSYVPQKPWIWNGTLRENILFGAPLDRGRYDAVVAACGLSRDLNELPAADETEIGEKGVNLSGGQQQRVALARAAYADSAVVLLDDVLSAVDSRVGARILDDLVDGPLFRGRTVVLCTHQLYWTYMRSAGGASFAVVWASLGGFVQAASFANRLSFGRWVATAQGDGGGAFGLYAATTALFVALVALRAALSGIGSWRASSRIHDAMLARLLGAPLAFFERTPSGRLLNRFSSDLASVDDELMDELYLFVDAAASLVAVVVVVVALVPLVVVAWVPVLLATSRVAGRYLATSRELKRLDSTTRSPIYGGFSEALSTIRVARRSGGQARKARRRALRRGARLVDVEPVARAPPPAAERGHLRRRRGLAVLAARARRAGSTTALGLVLLYATQWVQSTNQVVRQHATVEMQMNYVERCDEYATKLPNEDPGGAAPPGAAPFPAGALAFEDVCLRYASSPTDTLRRVSFAVAPGAAAASSGAGAGKSTLVTALLRLAPLAGGRVLVDGVDVAALPLAALRRGVAVVPQAATLFGTCTVLCVAHRLRTVAGFDRVVVLDRGAVAAFGPPGDFLRDEASPFFDLCHASGELDVLRRLAAGGPRAD